ncbi:MAG TPA: WYL domain-containing protein, partial [Candidatus Kapabacteria bacterium]|nr:WYL domain-containing protein [Candidatus Kapabacteria bacterium]
MDRQERLTYIIRLLQDMSLNSMEIKARFPGVSPRTIERDLEQLAQEGRIHQVRRDRSRNPTWETGERAPTIEVRWMNGRTAAAIKVMESCLATILPNTLLQDLRPLFSRADIALKQAHNREYANWLQKIRIRPSLKEDENADVTSRHLGIIQEALLKSQAIHVTERPDSMTAISRTIHPQGLLFSRSGAHLIATDDAAHDIPLQICIQDISEVELLDQPSNTPAGFNLDHWLDSRKKEEATELTAS